MIPKAVEVRLGRRIGWCLKLGFGAGDERNASAVRARIVFLAAEGRSTRSIAAAVGVMPSRSAPGGLATPVRAGRLVGSAASRSDAEI